MSTSKNCLLHCSEKSNSLLRLQTPNTERIFSHTSAMAMYAHTQGRKITQFQLPCLYFDSSLQRMSRYVRLLCCHGLIQASCFSDFCNDEAFSTRTNFNFSISSRKFLSKNSVDGYAYLHKICYPRLSKWYVHLAMTSSSRSMAEKFASKEQ